jgi:hypothetical protein
MKENLSYQQGNKFIPKNWKIVQDAVNHEYLLDSACETNTMKDNFLYWTSGNKEIDECDGGPSTTSS